VQTDLPRAGSPTPELRAQAFVAGHRAVKSQTVDAAQMFLFFPMRHGRNRLPRADHLSHIAMFS
jgi:hypothetical protein